MGKPVIHELKCVRPWFGMVFAGEKTAELRRNDRNFQQYDRILLREWLADEARYTSGTILAEITSIVSEADGPWLTEGHVMLSFRILDSAP